MMRLCALVILTGCDQLALDTTVRSQAIARQSIDFVLNGDLGPNGLRGVTGPAGTPGADATAGLGLQCSTLLLEGEGGIHLGCGFVSSTLTVQGSNDGSVTGQGASAGGIDDASLAVFSAGGSTPALVAESSGGIALRAVGGADFDEAYSLALPARWVVQVCGDDTSENVLACTCTGGINTCRSALARCAPDEVLWSGACTVLGSFEIRAGCFSNAVLTCSQGAAAGFNCQTVESSTVIAYAMCVKKLP